MVTNDQNVKKIMTPDGEAELVYVIPVWDGKALPLDVPLKAMGGDVARVKLANGIMGWYAAKDCSIIPPPSGHLYFEDGVIKIMDTVQARYNFTREWAAALLEDGTVLFEARLTEKGSDEIKRSPFRLTKGTIATLRDFLPMVFRHFQIDYIDTVNKMNEDYQRGFPEHYKKFGSRKLEADEVYEVDKSPDTNALLCAVFSKVKFPAYYDQMSQSIMDADCKMLFNIRGWAWIQKLGENAGAMQDAFGEEICKNFNSSYGKKKV